PYSTPFPYTPLFLSFNVYHPTHSVTSIGDGTRSFNDFYGLYPFLRNFQAVILTPFLGFMLNPLLKDGHTVGSQSAHNGLGLAMSYSRMVNAGESREGLHEAMVFIGL